MTTPTLEERQKKFAEDYNALVENTGISLVAVLEVEQLNDNTAQQRARLKVVINENWKPAEAPEPDNIVKLSENGARHVEATR